MNQSITWQKQKFKSFDDELKVNLKKRNLEEERRKFLDYLSDNTELLGNFSEEQLMKILKYSESENERKRKLLNGINN